MAQTNVQVFSGNVGIGTDNPADMLNVNAGNIRITQTTDSDGYLQMYRKDTTGGPSMIFRNPDGTAQGWFGFGSSYTNDIRMVSTTTDSDLSFWTNNTRRMTIDASTGIITTTGGLSTSVTPGSYLTGSAYNGSTARTFAVDATTTSTASKVVARDASKNVFVNNLYVGDSTSHGITKYTGQYGSVSTLGAGTSSYAGYAIRDDWVFMSNGSSLAGIYDDTNNKWATRYNALGSVQLYYSGNLKLETTSTGVTVTGTVSATTFEGALDGNAGSSTNVRVDRDDTGDTAMYLTMVNNNTAENSKRLYMDTNLVYDNTNNELKLTSMQIADYIYHAGDTDTYFGFDAADHFRIVEGGGTRLQVDSNGRIGIGTTAPDQLLDVDGRIRGNTMEIDSYIYHVGDTNTYFGFPSNDTFRVVTSNVERFRVQSDGKTIFSQNTRAPQMELPYSLWYNNWYGNNALSGTYLYGQWAANGSNRNIAYFEQSNFWNGNLYRVNFTGQHRVLFNFDVTLEEHTGLIVSSIGKYANVDGTYRPSINESVPIVELCDKDEDKKCFGVVSGLNDTDQFDISLGNLHMPQSKKHPEDIHVEVNSVGEGSIWVSNKNGNLENGDYITTSSIVGYGQKQSDDTLHNYTVAKITCDCDFNESVKPVKIPSFTTTVLQQKVYIKHEHVHPEHWRGGEREEDKQYTESPDTIDWNVVVYTETDDTYHYMKDITKRKPNFDENGLIFEDDLTEENKTEYDLRYIKPDGTIITKDEYYTMLSNNEVVYKAAFVGCTYHCG